MPKKSLDFRRVDEFRKAMMLSMTNMAELLGVSRLTYTGWCKGKPIRRANEARAVIAVRDLLAVMTDHNWPSPAAVVMTSKERFVALKALLPKQELEHKDN